MGKNHRLGTVSHGQFDNFPHIEWRFLRIALRDFIKAIGSLFPIQTDQKTTFCQLSVKEGFGVVGPLASVVVR